MSLLLLLGAAPAEQTGVIALAGQGDLLIVAGQQAAITVSGESDVAVLARTSALLALSGQGDVSITASTAILSTRISLRGRGDVDLTVRSKGSAYRVMVVDAEGDLFGELEQATVTDVSFSLNAPDTWSVTFPANDPKLSLLTDERLREVQIWRGDRLLTWGPAVRVQTDMGTCLVSGAGADWHLGRRTISRIPPTEYLANPSFEDGLASWNLGYDLVAASQDPTIAQPFPPTAVVVTSPTLTGGRAVKLTNTYEAPDAFMSQQFEWTVDDVDSPLGDVFTARAYCYIDPSLYTSPPYEHRGLLLQRFSTTELDPDPIVQAAIPGQKLCLQSEFAPLDDDTKRSGWVRLEVPLEVPPKAGEAETIVLRLYAPRGSVYWDSASLTRDEALNFTLREQVDIASELVTAATTPLLGKSSVNLTAATSPTGITRNRSYRFSEHINAASAIGDFTALSDGFDISMEYTPRTRTLRTHYPRRGSYKARAGLVLGKNVSAFQHTWDGEQASTAVVVLGEGDGSDRESGIAIDTSTFSRGVIVEDVSSAPPETPIDSLDKLAAERLAVGREPEVVEVTLTDASLLDVIEVGDFVPLQIIRGALEIDATYRIVRMSISATEDRPRLTLNRRDP